MIYFTNTMTGKKELFVKNSGPVTLYVCGITPYSAAHIGHGRCYISFDLLYRLLHFLGYTVLYCRNITDIDDKLLNKAQQEFNDRMRYQELATQFFSQFKQSLLQLGCLNPTYEPRVTDHIPEIITFITKLIESGHAYQADGDVYFSIQSWPSYGKLSGQKVDELRAGTRFAVRSEKKDPLDFVLWKGEQTDTFWQSPWGNGRPGWHIECSALAARFLGEHIDVHAGGLDLIFPHHENEVAQSEALFGIPFARYWLHNGLVTVNNEKMSKSLGNFIELDTLLQEYDPMVIRYYFLTYHYKSPAEFNAQGLQAARKTYERLINLFTNTQPHLVAPNTMQEQHPIVYAMHTMLCDDLNVPGMLGVLFEHWQELTSNEHERGAVLYYVQQVLGLSCQPLEKAEIQISPEIAALLEQRDQARRNKDWQKSDELREQLRQLGFEVKDHKVK